ncbi:hypothetical protein SD72_13110 [Leucobacter komagatae]|uniref:Uncharacterized protein n=1 Tax=Leucobacter komagatae TaxID=55969 RepID=A0A0D0H3M1_9MICO|nr:hypothetical protein SD72_13110 [Leucobacter komagatae]
MTTVTTADMTTGTVAAIRTGTGVASAVAAGQVSAKRRSVAPLPIAGRDATVAEAPQRGSTLEVISAIALDAERYLSEASQPASLRRALAANSHRQRRDLDGPG